MDKPPPNQWRQKLVPRRSTRRSGYRSEPGKRGLVTFFTGSEAFEEVAKEDGAWNWALVGPDPETLPLSGGGAGCIEEMRGAIGNFAFCFGLLRVTFGTGLDNITKFVYVEASNQDDADDASGTVISAKERGLAAAKSPLMKKEVQKFVHPVATLSITSVADCTLDNLLSVFRRAGFADVDELGKESYDAAMEEFRQLHAEVLEVEDKAGELAQHLTQQQTPIEDDAAELQAEADIAELEEEVMRLRRATPMYKEGDQVMIYRKNEPQAWLDDAEVVERARESGVRDGFTVESGSVKVMYNHRKQFKWVSIPLAGKELRPSDRPSPPKVRQGELEKKTHRLFARWNVRFFMLRKGFLLWWASADDAFPVMKAPSGMLSMLGLQSQILGTEFNIKCAGSRGTIYSLRAPTDEIADEWLTALRQHAAYSTEVGNYIAYKDARLSQSQKSLADMRASTRSLKEKRASSRESSSAAAPDTG